MPVTILDGFFSFDTETHLIQPGLAAPPLVCGSVADMDPGSERLLSAADTREWFRGAIPGAMLAGSNLFYDLGVMAADDPTLLDLIFEALEQGRLYGTEVLEKLHSNGAGTLNEYDSTSLATLETKYLGIDRTAEKEDGWRLRYALLDGVPLSEWPDDAIQYPRRDARGTVDVAARQLGLSGPLLHEWAQGLGPVDPFLGRPADVCKLCGSAFPGPSAECPKGKREPRHNLQCVAQEMQGGWALHLASIWGIRTDPVMVPGVIAEIKRKHEESRRKFFDAGIVRVRPCNKKEGEYEKADEISAEWLAEREAYLTHARAGDVEKHLADQSSEPRAWILRRLCDVEKAAAVLHKQPQRGIRFAEDRGVLRELVSKAYDGNPPMSAGGEVRAPEISISRDTLTESGNPLLEEYGEAGPNEKLFSTYVDVLEQGTRVPINPRSNSTLTTQRTSYFDPNLQQLPRKGPIRECFIPRPGWVYSSVDYSALELATLAQCCINLGLKSTMADAINGRQDLHVRMASRVLGISYADCLARYKVKEPAIVDVRQSMKPVNYGLGGLMGPPKLVLTARKDGIYFCEGVGVSKKGECWKHQRVTTYGRGRAERQIPPTCPECLRLAAEYKQLWYEEFPEMVDYHDVMIEAARRCADDGVPVESFGTGMLRLESGANAVSNHYFQNLAAQGAKHAAWLISKESYTDRSSVLFNNFRIVIFLHDETFGEAREAVASECGWRQSELMLQGMKKFVPDVRIDAEPTLMRRWFKGAEKAIGKDGRLKPWWPREWKWEPDQAQMAADRAA